MACPKIAFQWVRKPSSPACDVGGGGNIPPPFWQNEFEFLNENNTRD
jgi:hypothetical protein